MDQHNPYIPVTIPVMKSLRFPYMFEKPNNVTKPVTMSKRLSDEDMVGVRSKRETDETITQKATISTESSEHFTTQRAKSMPRGRQLNKPERERVAPAKGGWPHFHVTYWMFYPYSQVILVFFFLFLFICAEFIYNFYIKGKKICTISLGPLGRLPIPVLFGMCLGTKRDFGSHVGDWEHMSLFFRGNKEPEVILEATLS